MKARLKALVLAQIYQGATARGLSLAIASAVVCGIFPLLGCTTLMCLLAGRLFNLNHPTLQAVNYLMTPVQLVLMPLFLRAGEWISGSTPLAFSPTKLMAEFFAAPLQFLMLYGKSGAFAVLAWSLVAPLVASAVFFTVHPVLRRMVRQTREVVPPSSERKSSA